MDTILKTDYDTDMRRKLIKLYHAIKLKMYMPKYQLFLIIFEGDKIEEIFWLNMYVDVLYNPWMISAKV